MPAAKIVKTPTIVDNYFVDFAAQLGVGETLTNPRVTAFDVTAGRDVTTDMIGTPAPAVSGTQVIFWYKGGTANHNYFFAVVADTSAGRTLEEDVDVAVTTEVS